MRRTLWPTRTTLQQHTANHSKVNEASDVVNALDAVWSSIIVSQRCKSVRKWNGRFRKSVKTTHVIKYVMTILWRDKITNHSRRRLRHYWRHRQWRHRHHGGLTPAAVAEAHEVHRRTLRRWPPIGCRLSMTTRVTVLIQQSTLFTVFKYILLFGIKTFQIHAVFNYCYSVILLLKHLVIYHWVNY